MPAETYLIGIAGPSGAGKTYLATHLAAALHASVLALDRYYRDLSHLSPEERARINFDAPEALDQELLVEQVARLGNNEMVHLPVYDFATHTRTRRREVGTDRTHTLQIRPGTYSTLLGPFTKACRKKHALESERSNGATQAICGRISVRGLEHDGTVPGAWDLAADGL